MEESRKNPAKCREYEASENSLQRAHRMNCNGKTGQEKIYTRLEKSREENNDNERFGLPEAACKRVSDSESGIQ